MIIIPLTSDPEQIFTISIFGKDYNLRVIFNSRSELYTLSIGESGESLVDGLALISGVNLLNPYNLELKTMVIINNDNSDMDPQSLPRSTLVFFTDEEVQEFANGQTL